MVAGLIVFLALLIKFCTVVVICPYCRKETDVGKGVFEFGERFQCYWCKRELDSKKFVRIDKKGKKRKEDLREGQGELPGGAS